MSPSSVDRRPRPRGTIILNPRARIKPSARIKCLLPRPRVRRRGAHRSRERNRPPHPRPDSVHKLRNVGNKERAFLRDCNRRRPRIPLPALQPTRSSIHLPSHALQIGPVHGNPHRIVDAHGSRIARNHKRSLARRPVSHSSKPKRERNNIQRPRATGPPGPTGPTGPPPKPEHRRPVVRPGPTGHQPPSANPTTRAISVNLFNNADPTPSDRIESVPPHKLPTPTNLKLNPANPVRRGTRHINKIPHQLRARGHGQKSRRECT